MAIKAIMLRKKIDEKKKALEELRGRMAEFETREADLVRAIEEAETDEQKKAVEDEIEKFEGEKADAEAAEKGLNEEIEELEGELDEEEKAQNTDPEPSPAGEERSKTKMVNRAKFFGFDHMERDAMFQREDVQEFLARVRTCIKEKRALDNVGLLIPEIFLGILRENVINYSKLYRHVNVRRIGGDGRMVIMGSVPEAIWTECCAILNEVSLGFNDVEVGCNKLGAFFAVCNAILEDSDINLANELITALLQGIGLALDKAILYGTGTKMPLGVMTRLVQTEEPSDYPPTARTWEDLSETNIFTIPASVTGADLFRQFIIDSGAAKGKYARGEKVWVMNETTYTQLIANAMIIDASGAIVSGVNGRMPVIGGIIEVLNFLPDNVIIGGFFELYLLAERATTTVGQSEHYRFIEDQTVFKATARYDGVPVIAEAFVAIGMNGVTPDATMTFAPDEANTETAAADDND